MAQSYSAGDGQGLGDNEGIVIPVPGAGDPVSDMAEDIRRMRVRYDAPQVIDPQIFNLAALQTARFDLTSSKINALMLTAEAGVVFGYFGDFTSQNGAATTTPHFVVSAGVVPQTQQFMIPPGDNFVITLQATAAGVASGSIIPMYL